jgi:hypothetical protein
MRAVFIATFLANILLALLSLAILPDRVGIHWSQSALGALDDDLGHGPTALSDTSTNWPGRSFSVPVWHLRGHQHAIDAKAMQRNSPTSIA